MIALKAAESSKYIFKHTLHISSLAVSVAETLYAFNDKFLFFKIINDGNKCIDWIEFYAVSAIFSNVKAATIS